MNNIDFGKKVLFLKYANDYRKPDGKFHLHCISHPEGHSKTDAFLFEYNAKYTLVDGGIGGVTASLDYLLSLRRDLLCDHPELIEDTSCKLKIDLMPSHMHRDHIAATFLYVIPCEFIEIDTVYMPPDSALDASFDTEKRDGDTKYRPKILKALKQYQSNAKVVNVSFGKENMLEFENGRMKYAILPSAKDYGAPENINDFISLYFEGREELIGNIPVPVVNSCSVWVHIKFGRHSFLLTGDTVKKYPDRADEPLDDMLRTYRERLGKVSVVKYPHHGVNRDEAASGVLSLKPGWIFCSAEDATAHDAIKRFASRNRAKVLNCGNKTYIFSTNGQKLEISTTDFPAVK